MLKLVAAIVGCLVLVRGLAWLFGWSVARRRRPLEGATAALAVRGFVVHNGLASIARDRMIAVAEDGRVALCELDRGGVRAIDIVARTALVVEALEDGAPLDDARAGLPARGQLVLRVTHAGRAHAIVLAREVPHASETTLDLDGYARMRGTLAWWRDALVAGALARPYPLASQLAVYAIGPLASASAAAALAALEGNPLPAARVVSDRDA